MIVPFEALWADMSGHNTLAMTNKQTFGPFSWICWNYARLAIGDALKFCGFRIIMLVVAILVIVEFLEKWNQ